MSELKESTLQQQVCALLSTHGIFYFSALNETAMMILRAFKIRSDTAAKIVNFLKKMGLVPGIPDIIIMHNKTSYFLELKVKNNTLSKQQKIIITTLVYAGYQVAVCYTLEQVQEQLRLWGIIR